MGVGVAGVTCQVVDLLVCSWVVRGLIGTVTTPKGSVPKVTCRDFDLLVCSWVDWHCNRC